VAAIDTFRSRGIELGGRAAELSAPDMAVLARYGHLSFMQGDSGRILSGIAGKAEVVVSEALARRLGLRVGDPLSLPAPGGPLRTTVRGVFYDYSTEAGVLMMDRAVYARHWRDPAVNNVGLYLASGLAAKAVQARLMGQLAGRYDLQIADNRQIRTNVLRIFDQTFAVTYALEAIAMLVAVLGIANSLLAILLQRTREIGILRAVGASKRQVAAMCLLEASVLSVWGHLVGSVCGIALTYYLVYVINRRFFGWTLQLHLSVGPFASSLVMVLLSGMLAATIPARVALRVRVAEAVRQE
jgi:putative ABC transport system permease protein